VKRNAVDVPDNADKNPAIFFSQYVTVATALNFQYGNAGIPNMSNHISVAYGAYVVSSVIRICMWILGAHATATPSGPGS
jgi:ABC-type branched-subunit amino acid transport system permease subunit